LQYFLNLAPIGCPEHNYHFKQPMLEKSMLTIAHKSYVVLSGHIRNKVIYSYYSP
jgi:hypothetical protein